MTSESKSKLSREELAKAHDGLCGVSIGDGPCSCLVHWVEALQEEVTALRIERRGYQIMVQKVWLMEPPRIYMDLVVMGLYSRAGGDALCQKCGLKYVEHPQVPDYPTFHVNCNDDVLKL